MRKGRAEVNWLLRHEREGRDILDSSGSCGHLSTVAVESFEWKEKEVLKKKRLLSKRRVEGALESVKRSTGWLLS